LGDHLNKVSTNYHRTEQKSAEINRNYKDYIFTALSVIKDTMATTSKTLSQTSNML